MFADFRYGPLKQYWTMRFEAKHSYFKKLTCNIGNFINLPYTLAMRHQKFQCYYEMDQDAYSSAIVDVGPGKYNSLATTSEISSILCNRSQSIHSR